MYTENEVECFFLVESSTAGLSVVQLVNSCTAEVGIFIFESNTAGLSLVVS